MSLARLLRYRVEHRIVTALSTRPFLYYGLRAATNKLDSLCVRRDTELVVEGFPRSANSSTVHAFLARQPRAVRVAHHKHHAAQLIRAANWNIPAILLIRRPADAIISLAALAQENMSRTGRDTGRGSATTFADSARAWIAFHEAVLPHLDHMVIAPFTLVTADLGTIIKRINGRWGTMFNPDSESGGPVKLGWHATPNDLRNAILREISPRFEAAAAQSPLSRLLERCNRLHDRIVRSA